VTAREPAEGVARVGSELFIRALDGVPTVEPGDDLAEVVFGALSRSATSLEDGDVVVVVSKIVSRIEGRFVDLSSIAPGERALRLAAEVEKDPRLVELILRESTDVSRKTEGALIVRHRLGFISANAAIDASNAAPSDAPAHTGPWVLTLPADPDRSAASLREALRRRFDVDCAVVITDSWGRPFRRGTVGFAIGVAGLPAVWDRRGTCDRQGRELQATETAVADAVAAAADLVAGQADESRPVLLVRGLRFSACNDSARSLLREPDRDLYA
jgi:coenzyme F420-0:L-glutamate ligase/coenzyme F420-1:gamma-L-glutamate ligase